MRYTSVALLGFLIGCGPPAEVIEIETVGGWFRASPGGPCTVEAFAPTQARRLANLWNEHADASQVVFGTYPVHKWSFHLSVDGSEFALFGSDGWFGPITHTAPLEPEAESALTSILEAVAGGVDCGGDWGSKNWTVLSPWDPAVRVRGLTTGEDHVATQVWLERYSRSGWAADFEVDSFAGRFWSLGTPQVVRQDGGLELTMTATNVYDLSDREFVITLGQDGRLYAGG